MAEKGNQNENSSKVRFHHTKGNLFRVIRADGVVGNITPQSNIFISFYNERLPIPDSVVYEITPEGELGEEIESERVTTSKGVIREMEVGIILDLDDAKSLSEWLSSAAARAESRIEETEETEESET